MRKAVLLAVGVGLAATFFVLPNDPPWIEWNVRVSDLEALGAAVRRAGGSVVRKSTLLPWATVLLPRSVDPRKLAGVVYVERNNRHPFHPLQAVGGDAGSSPDWWQAAVHLDEAHALSRGAGVKVAVLDSGFDGVPGLPDPIGHGTGVLSLLRTVAPRSDHLLYSIMDSDGMVNDAMVASGIELATIHDAQVINMSFKLQDGAVSQWVHDALELAISHDTVLVVAAGNQGESRLGGLARHHGCFAVGAMNQDRTRAFFSSYGVCPACPEVMAPAGFPGVGVSTPGGGYFPAAVGTSEAAPMVSGAIALALSVNRYLKLSDLDQLLGETSEPLGPVNQYGWGLLRCDRLVTGAQEHLVDTVKRVVGYDYRMV